MQLNNNIDFTILTLKLSTNALMYMIPKPIVYLMNLTSGLIMRNKPIVNTLYMNVYAACE